MSTRTKILALLAGLLLFMTLAIGTALALRARASEGLTRVTGRDVPLLVIAVEVNDAYTEQAVQLERAIRYSRDRVASPAAQQAYEAARREYDARAATIWHRLQAARDLADEAMHAEDPGAATLTDQIARIDAAHNAYAEHVRGAFDHLEAGDRSGALIAANQATTQEQNLEAALSALLASASSSAESAAADAEREERVAQIVSWTLLGMGLLLAGVVFATVVRLVSDVRELSGLLPICSSCKSIRDDQGYWTQLEGYLEAHSNAAFTHGLCSGCKDALMARTRKSPTTEETESTAHARATSG